MDQKHDEYDGIVENDNPMPRWWLATFYLTIVFAAVYFALTQYGKLKISDEYVTAMAAHQKLAPQGGPSAGDGDAVQKMTTDPKMVGEGRSIFLQRCAICHANDGGGGIGPNLTDNFWLNCDGKAAGILTVVSNGVDGKGMPPWKQVLSADEVKKVTAFVLSLRGSKPAKAKPPQGDERPI